MNYYKELGIRKGEAMKRIYRESRIELMHDTAACSIALTILALILATIFLNIEITKAEQVHAEEINAEEVESASLHPDLLPICACESAGNPNVKPIHFKDGKVLVGELTPEDVGMCQISLRYWSDTAIKLGYNVLTEEGNIQMANYLYQRYGSKPWAASSECHKK